ncbi:MAG: oligosaccharide repeat unit polymerase [Candidatus Hydrothermarchaeales archaeon]
MSILKAFSESKIAGLVNWVYSFLESATFDSGILRRVSSGLKLVYPAAVFDFVDRKNSGQKSMFAKNIFSPVVIIPLVYALFISMSTYRISNLALLTIGAGLIFFYIGYRLSNFSFQRIRMDLSTRRLGVFFFYTGLFFLTIDLLSAGEIPLFNPSARLRLVVHYTMLAQLIPPGGIFIIAWFGGQYKKGLLDIRSARVNAFLTLFVTLLLISSLGFRTQIIVAFLGGFIAMYLTGLVGFVEVLFGLGFAGLGIAGLGYYRAVVQGSPIAFSEVLGARIGLTLSVFDYLVQRFMPFGANKGYTLLATFSSLIPGIPGPRLGPRTIVARLFGIIGISITSTLLGTIVLDLGIVGVALFMLLLGHVLGTGYRAAKTGAPLAIGIYAVLLAYTIVGIETGLVDFNVVVMFLAGYLLLRTSVSK